MKNNSDKPIVMIGPDLKGLGGISNVARSLFSCGLFTEQKILYIGTTLADAGADRFYLLHNFFIYLKQLMHGCRAVYVHTSSQRSFYRKSLFILTAKLFGIKTVLHIHPTHFRTFVADLQGWKRKYVMSVLAKIDVFITLTVSMQQWVTELFPGKPVHQIWNPVDTVALKNDTAQKRLSNSVVYLGSFLPDKGVYDLVDAAVFLIQQEVDFQLDFYGNKQVGELKRYVKKRGVEQNVKVHGWIGFQQKKTVLHKATVLVLPSYTEGVPNVALEAFATKTPFLSTKVGGLQELLIHRKNSYVTKEGDPRRLADDIAALLGDEILRKDISERAYFIAESTFDLPMVKRAFEQVLATI